MYRLCQTTVSIIVMEEVKKIYKFDGEEGEDYHIWAARTEAALEAKDVLSVVLTNMVEEESSEMISPAVRLSVAKAKATIIQGLGNKPLRLVLPVKDIPYKMWQLLKERYAVSNLVTKVQLHTKLARMNYKGQVMSEYVGDFECIFNQLASMGSVLTEDMKVATFLASFGDKSRSSFGQIVTVLQSKDTAVSWELVSSTLLQEYEEQLWASTARSGKQTNESSLALNASGNRGHREGQRLQKKKRSTFQQGRKCWECGKKGHLARDHKNGKIYGNANARQNVEFDDTVNAHHATLLMAISSQEEDTRFLIDSGASDNMVNNIDWLTDVKIIPEKKIMIGNGDTVSATHSGTLKMNVRLQGGGPPVTRAVTLERVLYVPRLKENLISCSALCRDGYHLTINRNVCVVWDNDFVEMQGVKCGGVYVVRAAPNVVKNDLAMTATGGMKGLWHDRLGHANVSSIEKLARKGAVVGLNLDGKEKSTRDCDGCATGKTHKLLLKKNYFRSERRGEIIHSDVSGVMSVESLGGSRYYVTFIDEYSRYVTVLPMAKKSEVLDKLKLFRPWFERKYDCKLKRLQCDGGGEYLACDDYLKRFGIERPRNPPYCPEVNGIAERANRSLMESARAMMQHANLPKQFWAEAVATAADIRNRFLCPRSDSTTSYEMLTGRKPRVDHIRVFGSKTWVHVPKEKRKKLDTKAREGVILACYDNSQYKVWMKYSGKPVMARHVRVLENVFPSNDWFNFVGMETEELDEHVTDVESVANEEEPQIEEGPDLSTVSSRPLSRATALDLETTQDMLTHVPTVTSRFRTDDGHSAVSNQLREDAGTMDKETKNGRYPNRVRSQPEYYNPGSAFLLTVKDEPDTVEEARRRPDAEKWNEAIREELDSLKKHNTWEITTVPKEAKVLQSRFIFKLKKKNDGTVARYKARLVVKGFMQGFVESTYSPVVCFSTVRTALAVAVQRGYYIHQMDVRTAFLHGVIDDDVFISPPKGSRIQIEEGKALKLKKGLYGLKQAPKLWYTKWNEVMEKLGMTALISDRCVFRKGKIWVLLYVDDVIIIGEKMENVQDTKASLSGLLDMKDMGELSNFLGVSFTRDSKGGRLSQEHYVETILSQFGMKDCKPVSTPVENDDELVDENPTDQRKYQELIGSLLFLSSRTRPDIAAAVNLLSRHCAHPLSKHMKAAKRVLRYLKGTKNMFLPLKKAESDFVVYSDADWAGDRVDRKSTSGALFQVGGSSVHWFSIKQKSVALSLQPRLNLYLQVRHAKCWYG